jgi:hypothetical protein
LLPPIITDTFSQFLASHSEKSDFHYGSNSARTSSAGNACICPAS